MPMGAGRGTDMPTPIIVVARHAVNSLRSVFSVLLWCDDLAVWTLPGQPTVRRPDGLLLAFQVDLETHEVHLAVAVEKGDKQSEQ